MKNTLKIISLVLLAVVLTGVFGSCTGGGRAIFSYKGVVIKDDFYRYWLSYYKTYYSTYYSDIEDTPEGWDKVIKDGKTAEDFVLESVNERMKMYAVALALFEENKLSLSKSDKSAITSRVDSLIESYGGKSVLEGYLKRSANISISTIKDVYTAESKIALLNSALFGEGGKEELTNEKADEFYKSHYARVKYLYFDKVNKYVTDEDGNPIKNPEGGYKTEPLSSEEKIAVKDRAEEALLRADEGVDFNQLIKEYNTKDMDYTTDFPNGYYISASTYTSAELFTLINSGLAMQIGNVGLYEDEKAIFIIARYELEDKAYVSDKSGQFENFVADAVEFYFTELLNSHLDEVESDDEFLENVKIYNIGNSVNV